MNNPSLFLTALTIATMIPGVALAASCDSLCGLNASNAQSMINDPACKKNSTCVKCVVDTLSQGQSGAYCSAYNTSQKGKTDEIINGALSAAATVTCGLACAFQLNPTLGPLCGYAGLASTVANVAFTMKDMITSPGSLDSQLMTLAGSALSASNAIKAIGKNAIASSTKGLTAPACVNTLIYGLSAASKIASAKKMGATSSQACMTASQLASSVNSPVQTCLNTAAITAPKSSNLTGLFAVTPDSFPVVSTSDVSKLAATAGDVNKALSAMSGDLAAAETAGKLDMSKIVKQVADGMSPSAIAADAGVPQSVVDSLKRAEDGAATSKVMASLNDQFYGSGSGLASGNGAGSSSGNSELAFGSSGATPGEGSDSLSIDRKPAGASAALANDGDVFHGSYAGTIFDIVTNRLKAQKGDYAQLDPEGRMNRLFNGFGETGGSERKPAAVKAQSK